MTPKINEEKASIRPVDLLPSLAPESGPDLRGASIQNGLESLDCQYIS